MWGTRSVRFRTLRRSCRTHERCKKGPDYGKGDESRKKGSRITRRYFSEYYSVGGPPAGTTGAGVQLIQVVGGHDYRSQYHSGDATFTDVGSQVEKEGDI